MKKETISGLRESFEDSANEENGMEYWLARDLQRLLQYHEWRKFKGVIEKAKQACKRSNNNILDHFVEAAKKVTLGSGAQREIQDFMLTRYACYLIAQNGDPRKESIAFAQSYFALQTRKQELIKQRIELMERLQARAKLADAEKEFSKLIYERGVNEAGFARIRSRGDKALFGGLNTGMMKKKLHIPTKKPLADFLPTITITAKNLATEITTFNVKKADLQGERNIGVEHVQNNREIRGVLTKRGIKPEELPAQEDLKKLQKQVKKEEQKIASSSKTIHHL